MTELLALRRPTPAHELINSVPKPNKSIPKGALPEWTIMGLENKIPLVNAPKNTVVFTRDKIGKKLWKKSDAGEMVLYDPNCLDVSYAYEPLHDRHLRNYFLRRGNLQLMMDLGLVTEDGDAVCTLKEFNEYRRYLRRIHLDAVNKERKRREAKERERRDLEEAKKYADIDAKAAVKAEQRKFKMAGVIAKLKEEEQLKRDDIERRTNRRIRRTEEIKVLKKMQKEDRIAKGRARDKRIKDRMTAAARIERQRIITTLRQWREGDLELKRRLQKLHRDRIMEREQKDQERWEKKIINQRKSMKRKQELLEQDARDKAFKIHMRNCAVQRERKKMDELFRSIRNHREREVYMEQKTRQSQYLANFLHKNWIPQIPDAVRVIKKKSVEDTVAKALLGFHSPKLSNDSVIEVLEEAKVRLAEKVYLPPPVTAALDQILDDSIHSFLKKKVDYIISNIICNGLKIINNIYAQRNASAKSQKDTGELSKEISRRLRTVCRKSRISSVESKKELIMYDTVGHENRSSDIKKKRRSSVGFGKTIPIGESALDVIPVEFKRAKYRPPTPVPSLTDLTKAVFEPPKSISDIEESKKMIRTGLDKVMFGREELINQLKFLSREISRRVHRRLEREIRGGTERRCRTLVRSFQEIVHSVVEGIESLGVEYTNDNLELEWLTSGVLMLILYINWMQMYKDPKPPKQSTLTLIHLRKALLKKEK